MTTTCKDLTSRAVYLAGAISGVSPEFARGWRKTAGDVLRAVSFEVFDPTEGKDLEHPEANTRLYPAVDIVEHDLNCIFNSDLVLAEVSRKDIPYHGTSMEIFYAHQIGRPVLVWGDIEHSYWVRYHATELFTGLEAALVFIINAYVPQRRRRAGK